MSQASGSPALACSTGSCSRSATTSIYTKKNARREKRFKTIVGNPKPEGRNPNVESKTWHKPVWHSDFGLRASFGFRISRFGFMILASFVLFGLLNCLKPLNNMVMSTVAEQLRVAREARNLTIPQVAEVTKIRTDHIRALEEGNFNLFSAPIYIRGSVKNYATLLKLDGPQIMAALNAELGRTEKFSEPPPLTEASNTPLDRLMFLLSKLNWKVGVVGAVVLGTALVVFFASFAWRHHKRSDPLAGLQPAVYQSADSGQTLPLTSHR